MNKFLVVLVLALVACDTDLDSLIFQQFQKFIKKFQKKYESMNEFLARYEVFRKNVMATFQEENGSYSTGITKFSDLTKQEFAKTYLNLNYDAMAMANFDPTIVKVSNAAPTSYDWRNYNRVAAVKDQGSCGSCWAFSTVANLEGLYAANKGVINSDYPYKGTKQTCKSDKTKYADFTVTGYKKLGSSWSTWSAVDEDEVKEFLYQTGPLAIALNADPLQTYTSGILDLTSTKCPSSGINHAVTLVGYGVDSSSGLNYWIVKNSWGKSWGESGYFRIRRGNGTCGINCYITTATVSF